jgi:3-phosphoshikimate 1-carboxyvinyltransferase
MRSIKPSAVKGTVEAPPSKSMTVRAAAAALLAEGTSRIRNTSLCDDGVVAFAAAAAMGADISHEGAEILVRSQGIHSRNGEKLVIHCGESGLAMRMFAPIAALLDSETVLAASGSLRSRPMEMVAALQGLGVSCTTDHGRPPITVRGPLEGGRITIDASVSSQFLTGLLMALPLSRKDSHVRVSGLSSAPYIRMTIELLSTFGVTIEHDDGLTDMRVDGSQAYRPSSYIVEGDWSGAAFLLVAGAIGGSVVVKGLPFPSNQADSAVLEALEMAGASVSKGPDSISVERHNLLPFVFDATQCPDLFPPLVALAACCEGRSTIFGARRLAHKESDRATALREEFGKLGIMIRVEEDRMEISGGIIMGGGVDSHNDHRIAMACSVAALRAEGRVIVGRHECVGKSYPGFFGDLETLAVGS